MSRGPVRRSRPGGRAFSLVETCVALVLVMTMLLTGLTLLTLEPRLRDRARAGEEAMRAIEAALETIRASGGPLRSGRLIPGVGFPVVDPARDLTLTLEVTPLPTPGLYELRLEATYLSHRRPAKRALTTLAWRPWA